MTPLRWTSKSLRTLAGQLRAEGHQASASMVQRLLHEAGYSPDRLFCHVYGRGMARRSHLRAEDCRQGQQHGAGELRTAA